MNKYSRIAFIALVSSALALVMAFAATDNTLFSVTSSTSLITSVAVDIGIIFAATITIVLGGWASLSGLGWAKRHFSKYITGKKF